MDVNFRSRPPAKKQQESLLPVGAALDVTGPAVDEHEVITRLTRIEELLKQRDAHPSTQGDYFQASPAATAPIQTPGAFAEWRQAESSTTIGINLAGLSRLSGQPCPSELAPLGLNDHEDDLEDELIQGETLFAGPPVHIDDLDLSPRRCWQLGDFFSREVLPWCPIMGQQACSELVSLASDTGFDRLEPTTPLTLLILAVGSFAEDSSPDSLPGLDYLRVASQLLDAGQTARHDIHIVQCHILVAFYLLHALRPIQAYESIHIASTKAVVLLQRKQRLQGDPEYRELVHRAYWACYLLEHELQAFIPYSSRMLQDLHEHVPLPTSDYEEPGIYWFSAEIALRRIFVSPRNGIGWNLLTLYEPTVSDEISNQLKGWHESLPTPMAFPLEEPSGAAVLLRPLIDPRKVYLRAQYYAFQCMMFWPNVIRLLTFPLDQAHPSPGAAQSPLMAVYTAPFTVMELATRSIRFAVLYIYGVESLLHARSLFLQANLVGLYAITLLLVCAYSSPRLQSLGIVHPSAADAVRVAWQGMSIWGGR